MRIIGMVLLVLAVTLPLQARVKVGLVLSGGGARGGAHVGVLKVLEAHRIPVDAIVGTSMGSLVGALYASGYRAEAIEQILTETPWTEYVAYDYDRTQIPFRRKQLQRAFPGDLKIGIDINGDFTLASGLFKRQPMLQFLNEKFRRVAEVRDFDDLPIPYRAVATDFANGESVTLASGSLPRSVYASLAIPGGFYPITIDGRTLVDGGVADNLPLDVMRREMDVDIIFVVDVSMPFEALPNHQSFLDIVNQLSNILVRKNTDRMLETLTAKEVLVIPELDGFSWLDPGEYPQIIAQGKKAMELFGMEAAKNLGMDARGYAEYRDRFDGYSPPPPPMIERIVIENTTYLDTRAIMQRLHVKLGEPLDVASLERDIEAIYNLTLFDDVTYRVEPVDGEQALILTVTPAADINGKLRFAFGFEDDFEGQSNYSVKVEYLKTGLNAFGGEWRLRGEIGIQKLVYTEWYQPLEPMQRVFARPFLYYRDRNVNASPKLIDQDVVFEGLDETLPIRAKERGAGLGLGVNLGNVLQLEGGIESKKAEPKASYFAYVIDADGTNPYFFTYEGSQLLTAAYAFLKADTMDHAFFPEWGVFADVGYLRQMPEWGSEADFAQIDGMVSAAASLGRHTVLGRVESGSTLGEVKLMGAQDFNAYYTLGGLFNLSGLPTNAIVGDQMRFGALSYRYRFSDKGFFGALEMPMYAGATIECGDAWYAAFDESLQWRTSGSLYAAVDTVLGPFYLAYGQAERGYRSIYLSLGVTFR